MEQRLPHSGVEGHPDYFWSGRAKKKAKKNMAPFGIRTHTSLNAQRFITLTVQTCDVTPLKVYLT
jgi:hypothetical protein